MTKFFIFFDKKFVCIFFFITFTTIFTHIYYDEKLQCDDRCLIYKTDKFIALFLPRY